MQSTEEEKEEIINETAMLIIPLYPICRMLRRINMKGGDIIYEKAST